MAEWPGLVTIENLTGQWLRGWQTKENFLVIYLLTMCPSILIAWGENVRNKSFGAGRGQRVGKARSQPASSAVQEMHARKIPGTGVAQTDNGCICLGARKRSLKCTSFG